MSKLNKILLVLVVVLLVILAVVIYWQKVGFEKSYWAVYLNTGDLYFGQLSRFPRLALSDVWFLQRNVDDEENPFSLSKFERVFWEPENKIYINEKNIVWKAKLKKDSQFLNYIKNPQAQQPAQSYPQQSIQP